MNIWENQIFALWARDKVQRSQTLWFPKITRQTALWFNYTKIFHWGSKKNIPFSGSHLSAQSLETKITHKAFPVFREQQQAAVSVIKHIPRHYFWNYFILLRFCVGVRYYKSAAIKYILLKYFCHRAHPAGGPELLNSKDFELLSSPRTRNINVYIGRK